MGLLSYIMEHRLDLSAPEVHEDGRIDAAFFERGNVAVLFTLDFSDAVAGAAAASPQDREAAFEYACEATKALLAPPSFCYPEQSFQIKVVLASDHEITVDLFAFQIVQAFTFAVQVPLVPDKIRVYPGGTAKGRNGIAAIENFLV